MRVVHYTIHNVLGDHPVTITDRDNAEIFQNALMYLSCVMHELEFPGTVKFPVHRPDFGITVTGVEEVAA